MVRGVARRGQRRFPPPSRVDTPAFSTDSNVAYLFNYAFTLVANGAPYVVPSTTCMGPIVPLIIVPSGEANQTTQVQVIAVNITALGYACTPCNFAQIAG